VAPCPPLFTAWQYLGIARQAADYVALQPWWRSISPPVDIAFELLPSNDAYQAWASVQAFAAPGAAPRCNNTQPCTTLRGAIIGPQGSAAAELVSLTARFSQVPLLLYGAPSAALTPSPHEPLPADAAPIFRLCHTERALVGALYTMLQSVGWRVASVVYALGDVDAAAAAELLGQRSLDDGACIPPPPPLLRR
jgi:hypothetical protein